MSECLLNIIIEIRISIELLMTLLSQIKPHEVMNKSFKANKSTDSRNTKGIQ